MIVERINKLFLLLLILANFLFLSPITLADPVLLGDIGAMLADSQAKATRELGQRSVFNKFVMTGKNIGFYNEPVFVDKLKKEQKEMLLELQEKKIEQVDLLIKDEDDDKIKDVYYEVIEDEEEGRQVGKQLVGDEEYIDRELNGARCCDNSFTDGIEYFGRVVAAPDDAIRQVMMESDDSDASVDSQEKKGEEGENDGNDSDDEGSENTVKKIVNALDLGKFYNLIIKDLLNKGVSERSEILADERGGFSGEEIKIMKSHRLISDKMEFGESFKCSKGLQKGWDRFAIKFSDGQEVIFSDRAQSSGELRGETLRNRLHNLSADLRNSNKDMTLYKALDKLVRESEFIIDRYLLAYSKSHSVIKDYDELTRKSLIKLARVCFQYANKSRRHTINLINSSRNVEHEQGRTLLLKENFMRTTSESIAKKLNFSESALERGLRIFLTDKTKARARFLLLTFNDKIDEKKLAELLNGALKLSKERIEALEWINKIKELAEKYPHNEKALKELVKIAQSILDFRVDPQSNLSGFDVETQIDQFKELLDAAKKLRSDNGWANYGKDWSFGLLEVDTLEFCITKPPAILVSKEWHANNQ